MTISLCVFSKNRPMQLDLFLRSLKLNAQDINDINVLYTYTADEFNRGYNILQQEHNDVNFIKEENIQNQILKLVSNFQTYFLWATDDSIFFKPFELTEDRINWVFKEKKALALNLRMGLNIKWQNHWHSAISEPIEVMDTYKDLILWDGAKYNTNTDVGRVWQNDASIMPRDMYLDRLLIEDDWKKHVGCRGLDQVGGCGKAFSPCYATAFKHSVYLNVPVNLVHLLDDGRLYADNWGKYIRQDIQYLNNLFLQGYRIVLEDIDFNNIDCGRKEIQYTFNHADK